MSTLSTLTNVSSNVLKLWLVGDQLLLGGNIDAHVTRELDGWRGHSDMDLSQLIQINTGSVCGLF